MVLWFWEIVESYTNEQKLRLLQVRIAWVWGDGGMGMGDEGMDVRGDGGMGMGDEGMDVRGDGGMGMGDGGMGVG